MPITEQSLSQGYPAYTFRVKLVFDQLAFIGSRSVWNDGCDPRLMGFDILPFECRGVVLWVPQTTDRTSCAYELNLTPDSRVASLLAPYSIHFDGRRITAWCHLYRTVLYHVQYMIPRGLLWHRIPVPCFHCPRLDEFWNHDSDALSPSMHRTTAGHGALSLRPRLPAFMCSVTLSCTTLQSWIWTVLRALYSGYSGVTSILFPFFDRWVDRLYKNLNRRFFGGWLVEQGPVGYVACLIFLQRIFGSIKLDWTMEIITEVIHLFSFSISAFVLVFKDNAWIPFLISSSSKL